jgi:hypothetical protein
MTNEQFNAGKFKVIIKNYEKSFVTVNDALKENLKSHKQFHENFAEVNKTLSCFRPQFRRIQEDVKDLEVKVEGNRKDIDTRESFIIWTFRGVWIGVSLVVAQWVLQLLKLWKIKGG